MGRVCSTKGEQRNAHRVLVGKTEECDTIRETFARWMNKILMDSTERGYGDMNWIDLT
jgi:hypothetical protein